MTRVEYIKARGWFHDSGSFEENVHSKEWREETWAGYYTEEEAEKKQLAKDAELLIYILENGFSGNDFHRIKGF